MHARVGYDAFTAGVAELANQQIRGFAMNTRMTPARLDFALTNINIAEYYG